MTATRPPGPSSVADVAPSSDANLLPPPSDGATWPLWGLAAGLLGVVGTLLSDTRPPETDLPIGADEVVALSPTGFHIGIVAGLAATLCLLVTAAAWRRWAVDHAPRNLAATVVPLAMTASAGAMVLGYGMKGSLAVYLPGGMDEGSYTAEALLSVFLFLDFAPYVVWWGVCFSAMAMGWLSLRDRLLPRWVGVVTIPFVAVPVAAVTITGLPGLPALDSLWLAIVSGGTALGLRRRR